MYTKGCSVKLSTRKAIQRKSLEVRRSRRREHAALVIEQITQCRAEGLGYRRIADRLNLGDVRPPRGGTWQPNQVRRIWSLAASESIQYVLPIEERPPEARVENGYEATGGDAVTEREAVESVKTEDETPAARIWRQVENGVDEDLLPTREKRTKDLAKKLDRELDKNGWRMFVSGCAYTMANGKGPQRRNAEVALVDTVRRWRGQVMDLLPDRVVDLERIVEAGLECPEQPPRKE